MPSYIRDLSFLPGVGGGCKIYGGSQFFYCSEGRITFFSTVNLKNYN